MDPDESRLLHRRVRAPRAPCRSSRPRDARPRPPAGRRRRRRNRGRDRTAARARTTTRMRSYDSPPDAAAPRRAARSPAGTRAFSWTPWPPGYRPVNIELCDGSVSGTVAYAWRNRRPRTATALNAGVSTPVASGPIASARVVSSVTSRIDGRSSVVRVEPLRVLPPPVHAARSSAHGTAQPPNAPGIRRPSPFFMPQGPCAEIIGGPEPRTLNPYTVNSEP